ncbi:MAG: hypothetical protein LUE24_01680 [Lachnospiraceae bacterium]|nr:hypothetical protein [Lachnospiraceae bacterium]
MTPYESLANAIIIQAVKDYRTALKTLKRNPDNMSATDTVNEVERFLRSQWYTALSDVSGEYLIRKLKQEVYGS